MHHTGGDPPNLILTLHCSGSWVQSPGKSLLFVCFALLYRWYFSPAGLELLDSILLTQTERAEATSIYCSARFNKFVLIHNKNDKKHIIIASFCQLDTDLDVCERRENPSWRIASISLTCGHVCGGHFLHCWGMREGPVHHWQTVPSMGWGSV